MRGQSPCLVKAPVECNYSPSPYTLFCCLITWLLCVIYRVSALLSDENPPTPTSEIATSFWSWHNPLFQGDDTIHVCFWLTVGTSVRNSLQPRNTSASFQLTLSRSTVASQGRRLVPVTLVVNAFRLYALCHCIQTLGAQARGRFSSIAVSSPPGKIPRAIISAAAWAGLCCLPSARTSSATKISRSMPPVDHVPLDAAAPLDETAN